MNKQELIDKLKKLLITPSEISGYDFDYGHDFGIERAILLAEDLDEPVRPPEPKPLELKKTVVPQFVADWIEECKRDERSLYYALESSGEINRWLDRDDKLQENEDIFARAWLDGCEIEKEKLYTVEIPNPSPYWDYTFLTKSDGEVSIDVTVNDCWKNDKRNHLTESEIKQDFEWAWKWAEEVKG